MSEPFDVYIDERGDLYMTAGRVVGLHSSSTATFAVGGGPAIAVDAGSNGFRRAGGLSGQEFAGGSGRNIVLDNNTSGNTLVPVGFFRPSVPGSWTGQIFGGATVTLNMDGSAEISDGTDIVADQPPATSTIAPEGTFSSTTYGETTYNGGNPFTLDSTYEGGGTGQHAIVSPFAGTAQGGVYNWTDWQDWESNEDSNWTITIDGSGDGELSDGTDIVATRTGGPLYDPSGTWTATTYGETTYNGSDPWEAFVSLQPGYPIAGWLYLELTLDSGTNEVTAVSGPFFAASLPGNSSTLAVVPVAYSDGLGGVEQIQVGPIFWKP